ncbi:MAG: hypothetical protein GOMPHAMPRED_004321 [Gomphillus americanus]|uniref:Uncharacterized protein n=1 Tax=Gomphillus americanus TaxID=1940652 RepID=A0A8H3FM67_9LECA|nr:MAG: hypothetical protein GOMPHAMPRED_004321 [Gomphillus americanus]
MNDLYEVESDYGLEDGTDDHNITTKLWMTSCKHIICNKHLPAGLAFYPQHEYPSVPCQFCSTRHETTLFWIRGTDHGQHEPTIPSEIFEVLERVKSEPRNHESLALEVHYRGATAAAKLFAAQTRVAIELLHKSKQCIKTLERENESLKSRLHNISRSPLVCSHTDFPLHPTKACQATSSDRRDSSRLTLKRPFQLSTPITRNTRVCLPERGVLHAYGTPRSINFHTSSMINREMELDIHITSPAFSTPCLRTNVSAKSSLLSPYPQRQPIMDNPRIVEEIDARIEGLDSHHAQNACYGNKALELRKTESDWLRY